MLFYFGPRSALLLPFVVPGVAAVGWLAARAWRRGTWPDALLALLILIPTLSIAQWMLGFAGWYDSHDGYSTAMFYVPWQLNLLLGPAYYFYFRSLASQEFRLAGRAWLHLAPGLGKLALLGVALAYDLGWWRGVLHRALPYHFGTKGPGAVLLDGLDRPAGYLLYGLLPLYCWWVLADYRRYTRYLDDNFSDPERLRFAGFRQLLLLQVGTLALSLLFEVLDRAFAFGYTEAWYYYALRGLFIYALMVVGVQANYAAATNPLRFDPTAAEDPSIVPVPSNAVLKAPSVVPVPSNAVLKAPSVVPVPSNSVLRASSVVPIPSNAILKVPDIVPIPSNAILKVPDVMPVPSNAILKVPDVVPVPSNAVLKVPAVVPEESAVAPASAAAVPVDPAAVAAATPAAALPAGLPAELHPWRDKLLLLMADEQPWLEPELTLTELAQRLRTNPGLLSKVINAGCGQNFNDFVNTYRVAEARRKLADPRYAHYSLVGVALESGFNSKSTFNRVFKKLTGQAPSEVPRP
jgi:AraC-like DNA-binding protein